MENPHLPSTDPTNPRYCGLPLGIIIAVVVAVAAMALVLLKYHPQYWTL